MKINTWLLAELRISPDRRELYERKGVQSSGSSAVECGRSNFQQRETKPEQSIPTLCLLTA